MFERVLGQENAKEKLAMLIKNGRVPNAMIFSGHDGVGKRMLAREFASELIGIDYSESSDYSEIYSDGNSIKIEQIRQMNTSISLKPYSNYKVYVIDEAEKLTPQAQNALLKTLEESPTYGIIVLVTKNELSLLETIRSRCMEIRFAPLCSEHLRKILVLHGFDEEVIDTSIVYSGGSASMAISLCDNSDVAEVRRRVEDFVDKVVISGKMSDASNIEAIFGSLISEHRMIVSMIMTYLRDACIVRDIGGLYVGDLIVNKDNYSMVKKLADNIELSKLGEILEIVERTEERLSRSPNVLAQLLAMSTRICELRNR